MVSGMGLGGCRLLLQQGWMKDPGAGTAQDIAV